MHAVGREREGASPSSDARQAFLLALSDALRRADDAAAAQAAAVRRVAEHFGATRVAYYEVDADGDGFVQSARFEAQDAVALPIHMRLSDYGGFIESAYRAGRTISVADVDTDPQTAPHRDAHRAIGVRAWVGVPLVRHGRLAVILGVHSATPRDWSRAEIELLEEVAHRTWAAAERARAEAALRRSEALHRALFDSVDAGVCLIERLPARSDGRRDYRYVAMNPAMQAMFGIGDLSGQSVRDSFPDEAEAWYDDYDHVLEHGGSRRVERVSEPKSRMLEMYLTRVEDASGRRLLAVMRDVTERRRHEVRQAYLLKLSDALRPLSDPEAIQAAACRVLGEHLGVEWVQYGEIDPDRRRFVIMRDWHRDPRRIGPLPSLAGTYPLDLFATHVAAWREGSSRVVCDAATDASLSAPERRGMLRLAVRAALSTPLMRDGMPAIVMAAASTVPIRWTADDVRLLEETAERTWEAAERGRAERALRDSEAKYRRLFERMAEGYAMIELIRDAAGRPVDFVNLELNQAFERQTGLPRERLLGVPFGQAFPHGETASWLPDFIRVVESGKASNFEGFVDTLGRWFEVSVYPQGGDRISVFYRDVTARKRAEDGLREREERLRRMVNIDGVGVLTFAMDGTLIDANDTFLQMMGYSRAEVESRALHWRTLTLPAWHAESEQQMRRLTETGRIGPYRKECLRKDGSRMWLLFAGAALGDGTVVEYCIDVSAQRRSESRYRSLFESIEQGFCIVEAIFDAAGRGVDYRFVEVNPAFERHTGIMVDAVGRTMRELVPDVESHWPEIYGRVAATGRRESFVDHSAAMGRWFEVDAFPIGEPGERQVAILFSDISERILADRRQQDSDRRKDEFLAVLGHELRNPLAPIRSGLDLLARSRQDPDRLDRMLPMMDRQVAHLTRLVDDLLDMSRITRGNIALRRAPIDLNDAVDAAVEQIQSLLTTRRHVLHVQRSREPLRLQGDADRLTQVVANLLGNAARYSRPGGTITVRTAAEPGLATVHIRDTGYGIPPQRLGELFEMFVQVPEHRNLDGVSGGLGIGLALARQLVRLHGGEIEARSDGLERGSEFIIRLPTDADVADRNARALRPDTESDAPRRILVVDDNADAALSLGMLLKDQGHEVEVASDGPAALDQVQRFKPQTVLLDIGLPGWDGIEVARRIRTLPGSGDVQIVAVTGWGQDEDRRRTEAAGFDHHLTKPVVLTELLAVMRRERQQARG